MADPHIRMSIRHTECAELPLCTAARQRKLVGARAARPRCAVFLRKERVMHFRSVLMHLVAVVLCVGACADSNDAPGESASGGSDTGAGGGASSSSAAG